MIAQAPLFSITLEHPLRISHRQSKRIVSVVSFWMIPCWSPIIIDRLSARCSLSPNVSAFVFLKSCAIEACVVDQNVDSPPPQYCHALLDGRPDCLLVAGDGQPNSIQSLGRRKIKQYIQRPRPVQPRSLHHLERVQKGPDADRNQTN